MNWKTTLFLGSLSTVLSAVASLIYNKIYSEAMYVDFSSVVGAVNIVSSCAVGCFLMAIGYAALSKWKGNGAHKWMNLLYAMISFASITGVFAVNLPLEIESPELLVGLVVPMHFFPLLAVLMVYPFSHWNKVS